jgi:vacuolar-type H+-ATPase subunit F/Vma7
MIYRIPDVDWPKNLANSLKNSRDADVILVSTEAQKELAERAKERMCPEKKLIIQKEERLYPEKKLIIQKEERS